MNKWRFAEYLSKAGFTQKSFAAAIGMSKNTLNNKLNGRSCFDTEQIKVICDKLDINDDSVKSQIFLS